MVILFNYIQLIGNLVQRKFQKLKYRINSRYKKDIFLEKAKGVIHVGAHYGEERFLYDYFDLNVLWIEPIPEVFDVLKKNIIGFPKQQAVSYLIADKDGIELCLNVASNEGASSSIFEFKLHKEIWPDISFERSLSLKSYTLPTILELNQFEIASFDTLVMDTQGSELLVLKGCGDFLKNFTYIKSEAAEFEAYEGCCKLSDLENYLGGMGFKQIQRNKFATLESGGSYYDVVFEKDI